MQVENLELVEQCFDEARDFIEANLPFIFNGRNGSADGVHTYTIAACAIAEYIAKSRGGTTLRTHAIVIARLVTRIRTTHQTLGVDDGN